MNREEYNLIKDLSGGDVEWMEQVGIDNPDDLADEEWKNLSSEEKTRFIESAPGWPVWIF